MRGSMCRVIASVSLQKVVLWSVGLTALLPIAMISSTSTPGADSLPAGGFEKTAVLADDRPACAKTYPLPAEVRKWTNCHETGQSACTGPEQCACGAEERLVSETCDEGTYHFCSAMYNDGTKRCR
jgi:hypothetical protein